MAPRAASAALLGVLLLFATCGAQPPACAGTCPVNVQGLVGPTSVTWDTFGNVYFAQKAGTILTMPSWVGTPTITVLTIPVSSFGDHGVTSILWDSGYLYVTYMKQDPRWGALGCTDSGQDPGTRPYASIQGCNIYGRVSRWPVSAQAVITGPEQVIIDTQFPDNAGRDACVQFSTHSTPTCIIASGDGGFYVAFGDGASFNNPDQGQEGVNPVTGVADQGGCDDNAP